MTLTWVAPGKGDWRGLHDHFPRALTPEYQLLLRQGMELGEAAWLEAYGLPVKTLTPAFVHGRVFIAAAPLLGPATNRYPPAPLMRLAVAIVPTFRRRAAAARRAVVERPWLAEAEHWYEHERAEWVERNGALAAVDPSSLDTDALTAHLHDVRALAYEGYRTHFRLHGPDLIPTSMLLSRAMEWGVDASTVASLLAGSSPTSLGRADVPDWQLVTGYDLDDRCAVELPQRPAPTRPAIARDASVETALRDRVPRAERAEWDELLADARATYGVRDDNGLLTGAWPVGLLRRAMLEVGERAGLGELAVELTVDELVGGSVSANEAAARLAERRRLSAEPAPVALGVQADLPLAALPSAMRRIASGLLALREHGITPPTAGESLRGVGIGAGPVSGRACVAIDPVEAFLRFEPGDIIVTRGTCPAWNGLLALAGGVVTEEGGPLSHAAVIARELGLPALVGARDACDLIPDGAQVELDPAGGTVRVQ